jgi:AcrR family transcriptional regulator
VSSVTAAEAPENGLRARKKRRTRAALIRAALEAFTGKGYDLTTVDEIAAAADVSQRTFFRYFAGKEDVALALEAMVEEHFLGAVAARPAGEPPFAALRAALLASWDTISAAVEEIAPLHTYLRMYQVIESTPALLAEQMRRSAEMEERLTEVVAGRAGLAGTGDPRPRVLVAAFGGVLRSAARRWGSTGETSVDSIREATRAQLDLLVPVLTQEW